MSAEGTPRPHLDGPVEQLALEYLSACEDGGSPPLDEFVARLPDPAAQRELRALIEATLSARRAFPLVVRPGSVLADRYQLIELRGEGGMSQVWAALDRQLVRQVAVKVLDAGIGPGRVAEFLERERQALVRLRHPGIVPIHDVGSTGGLRFLVMDLVPGRSLAQVLDELRSRCAGPPLRSPSAADLAQAVGGAEAPGRAAVLDASYPHSVVRLVVEVLRALEAAHAVGVVHRDLKPGNVLVLPGGVPQLVDFGLAGLRHGGDGPVSRSLYGSPGSVAPEQVTQLHTGNDPRSDVYQAGLLLYALLTLRDAFPLDATPQTLERIRSGDVRPVCAVAPHLPRALSAVVARAMAPDPATRYQTARAFRADLERWLGGQQLPDAARADAALAVRLRWFVRRHRLPLLIGALVLALCALVLTLTRPPRVVLVERVDVARGTVTMRPTRDGQRALRAVLFLMQDGRPAFVVPLRAAPAASRPAPARAVEFALPDGIAHDVLSGSAGRPELLVAWAQDAELLARIDDLEQQLGRYMQEFEVAPVPYRGLLDVLDHQEGVMRAAGSRPATFYRMTRQHLLGEQPLDAPDLGIVRIALP